MHPLIIVVAFAFVALTPYMHALPRSGGDSIQIVEQSDVGEADAEDNDEREV